jgi:hypothetical protein
MFLRNRIEQHFELAEAVAKGQNVNSGRWTDAITWARQEVKPQPL